MPRRQPFMDYFIKRKHSLPEQGDEIEFILALREKLATHISSQFLAEGVLQHHLEAGIVVVNASRPVDHLRAHEA